MPNRAHYTFSISDRFSGPARRIRQATLRIRNSMGKLERKSLTTSMALGRVANRLKQFGPLAIGAGMVVAVKQFGNLQDGIEDTLNLLTNRAEIPKFRHQIKSLTEEAIKMGFSMEDANKGIFDNMSAMGFGAKAVDTFRAAQKLSIAGNATLGASVLGLTKLQNAYVDSTASSEEIAAALMITQQLGQTTIQELGQNIGKVSATARANGIEMNEFLAVYGQLTKVLANSEEAATGLKALITSLSKAQGQQAKVLKALNIPFGANVLAEKGLIPILRAVNKARKENANAIAFALPNVRASNAAAALSNELLDGAAKAQQAMNDKVKASATLTAAQEAKMELFNESMKRARGELSIIGADIGENLVPVIEGFGRAAKDAFEGMKIAVDAVFGAIHSVIEAYGRFDAFVGSNPLQVFGEGGFLDRRAEENKLANPPKFDQIPPSQVELAITTASSPGSTIENVTVKSSGTNLKTGINNVTS